ncbi:hypothetical protein NC651_013892 [Populus alba x Populus x berolinensis]|nr:hypothetical protein NC651_013892 [Populus alba x Populus x berolinensis]
MIMAFCFWLQIDDDNFLNLLDEVLGFVLIVWPKTRFLLVEINKTIRFRAGLKLSSAMI